MVFSWRAKVKQQRPVRIDCAPAKLMDGVLAKITDGVLAKILTS
jgi:hypothetical protein